MTVLGYLLLLLALLLASGATAGYAVAGKRNARPAGFVPQLVKGSAILVLAASAVLLVQLLRHDFANGYVYSYSDRSLPVSYLISSFYAGQEGSFLFWALCSAVISLLLMRSARTRRTEAWVMTVFMAVQSGLLILVAVKSPFTSLWSMFPDAPAGQLPVDGHGLNPLLQNLWMVVHPPVLFAGFALMAVPFSLAVAGLWKRDAALLAAQALPWVLAATGVLGLGIMLGAYWAYGVLGWGGYWGWDPVENSSLVPWLTGMALLHTLLAQLRTGKYVRTNFVLALVTFFLVVYSTFLTRSGILGDASVHSFTDPGAGVYWMLVVFLMLIAGVGAGLMLLRAKELAPAATDTMLLTRETALGAGSIALLLSAAVTLFGTSLPIFSTTRVETSFYDTTHLPIAFALVLLIGISLYTQWEMQDGRALLRRSALMAGASLGLVIVLLLLGVRDGVALLLVGASAFALLVNLEIAFRVARGNPRFLGGKLAHCGVALFLMGVIATGRFAASQHVVLPLNAPQQALGHVLTYTGSRETPDGKVGFTVTVQGTEGTYTLVPVMFDAGQQGVMRTPDIASFLTRDLYMSPVAVEQPGSAAGAAAGPFTIGKGETISLGAVKATFAAFDMRSHGTEGDVMHVGSVLQLSDGRRTETVTPAAVYRPGAGPSYEPAHSDLLGGEVRLVNMNVGMGTSPSSITVEVQRASTPAGRPQEALVVDVSVKPYINLLWGGTLVMLVGFGLSVVKRAQEG